VSLVGTFLVFPLGFSINTLSLFGLVLAIGLVVDDAIVVVEAVERHIEEETVAACDLESDGGGVRPSDHDCVDFGRGVGADRIYSWDHGRALPTVAVTTAVSVVISAFNALTRVRRWQPFCCG
jgi:HAE1 family hydrophobic/amphiphilic exporter-1